MAVTLLAVGLSSFVAGAILCRLYYAKAITLGRGILARVYGDYELAIKTLKEKL